MRARFGCLHPSLKRAAGLLVILALSALSFWKPPYGLDAPEAIGPFLNGIFPASAPDAGMPEPDQPPSLLSETGAFKDLASLEPSDGLIPYALNVPFWSDGALKTRWIAIPNDGTHDSPEEEVIFDPAGPWQYPTGTVAIKHFELATDYADSSKIRRLETRFLVAGESGFYGLTYRWNEEGTDAELLEGSFAETLAIRTPAGIRLQSWHYPGRDECLTCHNPAGGRVLGPQTRQLNGDFFYEETGVLANQLASWNHIGLFATPIDEKDLAGFITSSTSADPAASIEERARSYLDSNCGYCHRPGVVFTAYFDARLTTPLANSGIINGFAFNNLSIRDAVIVAPGDTSKSLIYQRARSLKSQVAMPPLAKARVDSAGLALIADWILSLRLRIVSVEPDSAMSGEPVLIRGNRFEAVTQVSFNGVPAEFTIDNGEQLTTIVPEGATTGVVEVATPEETAQSASPFTVLPINQTPIEKPAAVRSQGLEVFPNPFEGPITVRYRLTEAGPVKLSLYDLQGRLIRILYDGLQPHGIHEITLSAEKLAGGIYYVHLESPTMAKTHPIVRK